jgi:hypothetical protein
MPRTSTPYWFPILLVLLLLQAPAALAQSGGGEIQASGDICSASWVGDQCFPFAMRLPPGGGPAEGYVEGSSSYNISEIGMTIGSSFIGHFIGIYAGGDGGEISGTWEIIATVQLPADLILPPNVQYPTTITSAGSWQGTLHTDGGSGTYTGSDTMGMPVSGTWSLGYDPAAFNAALPSLPPSALTPTVAATPSTHPTPTATMLPAPSVTPVVSLQALVDLIGRQRTLLQSGLDHWRPGLVPWFGGQLVTAGVEGQGQAYVEDVFGRHTQVNDAGLPLTGVEGPKTPSQLIISDNPDLEWGAQLEDFGTQAWDTLQNLLQPGVDFIDQTLDSLNPSEQLSSFLDLLQTPLVGLDDGLPADDSRTIQVEAALLLSQQDAEQDCQQALGESACNGEKLDLNDPSDYAKWDEKTREGDRYYYTDLMGQMKPEEWDRLVEGGFDPVKVIQSRRSMNEALKTINGQIGSNAIDLIEKQFGLDRKAADQLKADLVSLGADPEKADEMARATQALRVIAKLGSDHTFSNQGLLNGMFRFVDKWIVRSQAQALMIEKLDSLTEEQLAMIQHADRGALVQALQAQQLPGDDPVYKLLLGQLEGDQP